MDRFERVSNKTVGRYGIRVHREVRDTTYLAVAQKALMEKFGGAIVRVSPGESAAQGLPIVSRLETARNIHGSGVHPGIYAEKLREVASIHPAQYGWRSRRFTLTHTNANAIAISIYFGSDRSLNFERDTFTDSMDEIKGQPGEWNKSEHGLVLVAHLHDQRIFRDVMRFRPEMPIPVNIGRLVISGPKRPQSTEIPDLSSE